jgi:hypothetical protein
MIILNDWKFDDGKWYQAGRHCKECEIEWFRVDITVVPVAELLRTYEKLLIELADKEIKLAQLNEEYDGKEFEIVYMSDIDFKGLYGSTAEKVRKHHAGKVLSDLNDEIQDLELSINWIKSYIPLLKEAIRVKQ